MLSVVVVVETSGLEGSTVVEEVSGLFVVVSTVGSFLVVASGSVEMVGFLFSVAELFLLVVDVVFSSSSLPNSLSNNPCFFVVVSVGLSEDSLYFVSDSFLLNNLSKKFCFLVVVSSLLVVVLSSFISVWLSLIISLFFDVLDVDFVVSALVVSFFVKRIAIKVEDITIIRDKAIEIIFKSVLREKTAINVFLAFSFLVRKT